MAPKRPPNGPPTALPPSPQCSVEMVQWKAWHTRCTKSPAAGGVNEAEGRVDAAEMPTVPGCSADPGSQGRRPQQMAALEVTISFLYRDERD